MTICYNATVFHKHLIIELVMYMYTIFIKSNIYIHNCKAKRNYTTNKMYYISDQNKII